MIAVTPVTDHIRDGNAVYFGRMLFIDAEMVAAPKAWKQAAQLAFETEPSSRSPIQETDNTQR